MNCTDTGWWYLSFADDTAFRGGVVVRGTDVESATKEAHRLKINPGGQVLGVPIPEGKVPVAAYRDRLLTREDCDACWDDCVRVGDVIDELDESKMPIVHDGCNERLSHSETGGQT